MSSILGLSRGDNVRESAVVIGRSQRNMSQSCELCVIPSIVQREAGIGLTDIDLVLTVCVCVWGGGGGGYKLYYPP